MAKKETTDPAIKKEKHAWGVRLSIKPFLDAKLSAVEITTDIAQPQAGRAAQTKTWFSGVPMGTPLRATDVVIWMEAMKAMQEESRQAIEKMKVK